MGDVDSRRGCQAYSGGRDTQRPEHSAHSVHSSSGLQGLAASKRSQRVCSVQQRTVVCASQTADHSTGDRVAASAVPIRSGRALEIEAVVLAVVALRRVVVCVDGGAGAVGGRGAVLVLNSPRGGELAVARAVAVGAAVLAEPLAPTAIATSIVLAELPVPAATATSIGRDATSSLEEAAVSIACVSS